MDLAEETRQEAGTFVCQLVTAGRSKDLTTRAFIPVGAPISVLNADGRLRRRSFIVGVVKNATVSDRTRPADSTFRHTKRVTD